MGSLVQCRILPLSGKLERIPLWFRVESFEGFVRWLHRQPRRIRGLALIVRQHEDCGTGIQRGVEYRVTDGSKPNPFHAAVRREMFF